MPASSRSSSSRPCPPQQAAADLRPVLADQGLVLLVGHPVDAPAQGLASRLREERLELPPVFRLDHLPAQVLEEPLEPCRPDAGHDPIEALAVEIHDPQQVAEPLQGVVQEGLPDAALVQLGIAHEGHETPLGQRPEVRPGVAVDGGGKGRGHGAQSHGARREVDRIGVLRPAGIGLDAPVGAQLRHVRAGEPPQQVLHGVEGGRGLGLDGDPVARLEPVEVEGRQDRGDGRGGGLVAPDLRPLGVGPHVVGVVDHAAGKPHDAPLDGVEGIDSFGREGRGFPGGFFLLTGRVHGIPPRRGKEKVRRRRGLGQRGSRPP